MTEKELSIIQRKAEIFDLQVELMDLKRRLTEKINELNRLSAEAKDGN